MREEEGRRGGGVEEGENEGGGVKGGENEGGGGEEERWRRRTRNGKLK